jgi:hypothetical protein
MREFSGLTDFYYFRFPFPLPSNLGMERSLFLWGAGGIARQKNGGAKSALIVFEKRFLYSLWK